jgi:hypothetical protein
VKAAEPGSVKGPGSEHPTAPATDGPARGGRRRSTALLSNAIAAAAAVRASEASLVQMGLTMGGWMGMLESTGLLRGRCVQVVCAPQAAARRQLPLLSISIAALCACHKHEYAHTRMGRLSREVARDLFRSVEGAQADFLIYQEFCEVRDTV